MPVSEVIAFWLTVAGYVGATVIYLYWFAFGQTKWVKAEKVLIGVGLAANFATMVFRSVAAGHLPVRTVYELNLVAAASIVGIYLWVRKQYPSTRLVGLIAVPFAFLLLGMGLDIEPEIKPLTLAYKSNWLVVHVVFAFLSTGCYVTATGSSIFYLLKQRYNSINMPKRYVGLPALPMLEELSYKLILIGFVAGSVMLLSGSIWAKLLWGKYWSWDPIEIWSLLSWLVYGIYLHLFRTYGWRGRKLAWFGLACLVINVISFWAVGLVTPSTYHTLEQITTPLTK